MKTFYRLIDNNPCLFEDDADIADWPEFSETPVVIPDPLHPLQRRLVLLKETDEWALTDRTMTAEQIAYRQALRDITEQDGYPDNVVWPTKPEV
jgi:hypothetical protein